MDEWALVPGNMTPGTSSDVSGTIGHSYTQKEFHNKRQYLCAMLRADLVVALQSWMCPSPPVTSRLSQ